MSKQVTAHCSVCSTPTEVDARQPPLVEWCGKCRRYTKMIVRNQVTVAPPVFAQAAE